MAVKKKERTLSMTTTTNRPLGRATGYAHGRTYGSYVAAANQAVVRASPEELLRAGARKMLQAALEMEVDEYIERSREASAAPGRQAVVRNGSHPQPLSWIAATLKTRPYQVILLPI